jgi:hypothetical protein
VEGLFFSLILLWFSTGLEIIWPTTIGWLESGDGTAEISWEFFRSQPLSQFPLGLNPNYGLEISSTIAFDGQIPLLSLLFHPLNSLLPVRFQYVGLFLFVCFILNYVVAKRIMLQLRLNNLNSSISSIIISTSPVLLFRYIDNDHYVLTSGFLLLCAIYLVLKNDSAFPKWLILYIVSILIFIYYTAFIFIIHSIFLLYKVFLKTESIRAATFKLVLILSMSLFMMFCVGFFYGEVSTSDVGFGLFRSTLTSLIDSSQWSAFLPDIGEPEGAYEGFGYIGLPSFILILSFLFFRTKSTLGKSKDTSFFPLWTSSLFLLIFSFSNIISFGTLELFEYSLPSQLVPIFATFRSSGRFIWLLVFVLFIWLVYKISLKVNSNNLSIFLSFLLILHSIDIGSQLSSQKNKKFANIYETNLTNAAWTDIRECYKNIRIYPPTSGVVNSYNFVNFAYNSGLGINTGRFGRLNNDAVNEAFELMHEEFSTGVYRDDSFYIFSGSEYVSNNVVDYHKNMAIHTLNVDSAYGKIDDFNFLAPNLKDCSGGNELKNLATGFGVPDERKFSGQLIEFVKNSTPQNFALTGFTGLEDWGTWAVGSSSKVTLNTTRLSNFTMITIFGKNINSPSTPIEVYLNKERIGNCKFQIDFSKCSINYDFSTLTSDIINLEFRPAINQTFENLGFGLRSLSLS